MNRLDHFARGSGQLDLFHGTSSHASQEIKKSGFSASYSDSAHFTDHPDAARAWGESVVHLRVPAHEAELHYDIPADHDFPAHKVYGLPADEDDMPGRLHESTVHCVDGPCTRRKR